MEPPWKYEGPPCSPVLHWRIIMAVITQLSLSRWHIYTPVRYLHINKQLASYKNTQTHMQRNTQAEYKQRWLCRILWHWWWLLCLSLCFYVFSPVFVTSYIKLHCIKPNQTVQKTSKQTQPAPNSVFEENKLLFLLFLPLVLSPLRQWGREG